MPVVSIVLPSYNGSKYICESIDSILSQTFYDWELIIVNDCSTDNTLDIAREYAAKDDRITVINNEVNQKLPASLNIGFRQAKGKYLTWTSDDNIYKPSALKEMYEFLECNHHYKMVCCDMDIIDSDGNVTGVHNSFDSTYMYYNNCVGACFMYHREVLDTVGEYNLDKFGVEDYDYWLRIMRCYCEIGHLSKNLYYYRVHDGSLTATKRILIRQQLLNLWYENLEWNLKGIKNRIDLLWLMYYNFYSVEHNINMKEVCIKFSNYIPVNNLICSNNISSNDKFVIFGAGYFGKKVKEILADKVVCFIDNNEDLVDKSLCGIKIIHSSKINEISFSYKIIIAVSPENIMEVYKSIDIAHKKNIVICHEFLGKELFLQN